MATRKTAKKITIRRPVNTKATAAVQSDDGIFVVGQEYDVILVSGDLIVGTLSEARAIIEDACDNGDVNQGETITIYKLVPVETFYVGLTAKPE